MDPGTGATTPLATVTGACWGDRIGGISADATTLWVPDTQGNCGLYPTRPIIRSYSLTTGAHLADYPIPADTRNIAWTNDPIPVVSVGGLLYFAYTGYNPWIASPNYCWPAQMFAFDKATGDTIAVAGTAPKYGKDASTGCDFDDVDGVGVSAQFSGVSEIASDGVNLYTVGANATNNRLRVVKPGPVVAPLGGAVAAHELTGAANPCFACANKAMHELVKDPIDTASGSFEESFTDLAISGRGSQAIWTRSYSSVMAADDGPLGFGWHTDRVGAVVARAVGGGLRGGSDRVRPGPGVHDDGDQV
jgi:Domain of unknown function (DUF6531)